MDGTSSIWRKKPSRLRTASSAERSSRTTRSRPWSSASAKGQELSEHTAAKPAMLFFVKGDATVGLGDDVQKAQAGTWVHMPTSLKHSIKAKTPVVMLLMLMK